jgi:hypothetical protein
LFFEGEQDDSDVEEIGLIEMNREMEFSPYKVLLKLSDSNWDIIGIGNSSLVLTEGSFDRDEKLTFYRIPTR